MSASRRAIDHDSSARARLNATYPRGSRGSVHLRRKPGGGAVRSLSSQHLPAIVRQIEQRESRARGRRRPWRRHQGVPPLAPPGSRRSRWAPAGAQCRRWGSARSRCRSWRTTSGPRSSPLWGSATATSTPPRSTAPSAPSARPWPRRRGAGSWRPGRRCSSRPRCGARSATRTSCSPPSGKACGSFLPSSSLLVFIS